MFSWQASLWLRKTSESKQQIYKESNSWTPCNWSHDDYARNSLDFHQYCTYNLHHHVVHLPCFLFLFCPAILHVTQNDTNHHYTCNIYIYCGQWHSVIFVATWNNCQLLNLVQQSRGIKATLTVSTMIILTAIMG